MMKERRKRPLKSMENTVTLLSNAQNFALGELSRDGGELAFARKTSDGHLAVVRIAGRLVTINRRGLIDYEPNITVRMDK